MRPLCRWCGRPIGKRTETIWFGRDPRHYLREDERARTFAEKPKSLAEAQRLAGTKKITSVRWHRAPKEPSETDHSIAHFEGEDYIAAANVWDGESYRAQCGFFCTNRCAMEFAEVVTITHGIVGKAFNEALRKQKEEA